MREQAAIVDRPRFTAIAVSGPEAADYLQGQLSNDVEAMAPGEGRYAALLDRKGHLQGDLRVLLLAEGDYLLLAESEPGPALLRHLSTYKVGREVEVGDRGDGLALSSVIGPRAAELTGAEGLGPEHAHRELSLRGASCLAVATDLGIDLLAAPAELESRARRPARRRSRARRARKLPRSSAWSRDAPASAAR